MEANGVIISMILVCLALIALIVIAKPIKFVLKFIINSILGAGGLMLANILLNPIGITVGVNFLTAGFVGLLGLPGFGAILLIQAMI